VTGATFHVEPGGVENAPAESTEAWHGTLKGYNHHWCRCDRCRAARLAYQRSYQRQWRIARMAAGLNVRGKSSKRPALTAASLQRATSRHVRGASE
jgi:hypothetical protein